MSATAEYFVFIDDWKGSVSGAEDSPICYLGHAFARRHLNVLAPPLIASDAAGWDAKNNHGLFADPEYTKLRALICRVPSRVYMGHSSFGRLDLPDVWASMDDSTSDVPIAATDPDADLEWKPLHDLFERTPYALGFLEFIRRVVDALVAKRPRRRGKDCPIKVSLCSDFMNFLTEKGRVRVAGPRPYPIPLVDGRSRGLSAELMFVGKATQQVEHLRPMLGLVDSEVYAFGRSQTRAVASGGTIRERYMRWQKDKTAVLPTDDEIRDALATEKNFNLSNYVALQAKWLAGGRLRVLF